MGVHVAVSVVLQQSSPQSAAKKKKETKNLAPKGQKQAKQKPIEL